MTPALYPAFFFVLEKAVKSAGNAVISTLLMHRSYGLQGSLKRRYKHPSPTSINGYHTSKGSWHNRLQNGPRLLSRAKVGTHSAFGERSHTAAHTPKQEPSLPRPQHSLELPAKSSPKEQPEEADARPWRVSASFGVAAPLGCVIFFCFCQNCGLHTMCSVLSACARRGVVSPLLVCSACCRNSRPPLVKTTNLPFSEIG